MVERSLFYASADEPVHLGPKGVGTFKPGATLTAPFIAPRAGRYWCVLTYALAGKPERVSIAVDGNVPKGWGHVELWPTATGYGGGSRSLYHYHPGNKGRIESPQAPWRRHRDKYFVAWVVGERGASLRAGQHEVTLTFHGTGLVLKDLKFVPGNVPQNTDQPWLIDGYVEFPGLQFTGKEATQSRKKKSITFRGQWHNLAPGRVRYEVQASVMTRRGQKEGRFRVVEHEPKRTLDLRVGESKPFSLTVEASEELPPHYSEIVVLQLESQDVPNLRKLYLMCAADTYLPVNREARLRYLTGHKAGKFALAEGTDPGDFIPTRESLGFQNDRCQRSLREAFRHALATASSPVMTQKGFSLSEWAKAGGDPNQGGFQKNQPLATIFAALGQGTPDELHKEALMLLADEMPFYPSGYWDASGCRILPSVWYERSSPALTSYVALLQKGLVTNEEHFRFLHNVVLPSYLCLRSDLRVHGVLGRPARAGGTELHLIRPTRPHVHPVDNVACEFLRVGTGELEEYVRGHRGSGGTVSLCTDFPGPMKLNHPAGTPWASFVMREWRELEAMDLWSYLNVAMASRDEAVVEQCGEIMSMMLATQNIFREDGSFANEPGSYGWCAFSYFDVLRMAEEWLGRDRVAISPRTPAAHAPIADYVERFSILQRRPSNAQRGWNHKPVAATAQLRPRNQRSILRAASQAPARAPRHR